MFLPPLSLYRQRAIEFDEENGGPSLYPILIVVSAVVSVVGNKLEAMEMLELGAHPNDSLSLLFLSLFF